MTKGHNPLLSLGCHPAVDTFGFFEDSKSEDIEDLKDMRSVQWVGNDKNPAPGQFTQQFIGTMNRAIIAEENCWFTFTTKEAAI
jgi:hypothetical protein